MGNKVNMYNYSGSNTPRHVQLLKTRCSAPQDTAQITFSTIHKAKGMEWDHVVLLEGALTTCLSHVNDPRGVLGRDEINLLYVSVTRAKKYLTVNATMLEVLRLSKERMEVVVGGEEVQEGCLCVQCEEPVDGKKLLVTKVFAMNVMMSCELTTLEGGYLCHACSTQPYPDVPGEGRPTLVSALQPYQDYDYSRTARLMLMCGRLPPQPTTD
ncbi:F-box DNA helicase 1 [Chionoecetes opilio]|uniref:F-box DNA helicase 1 n=1 Tax=Chionoecetes opilio TaxID=41210 RepID=A0A8J4YQQ4_CHIOP|nr:F-box DNA helicase 1 [Chionoecetes opilio]